MNDYKQRLIDVYFQAKSLNLEEIIISQKLNNYLKIIADNCLKNKGVYTVLITLLIYKVLHPNQDIRYHQANMKDKENLTIIGFSGRSIDTNYITPTLKELSLPSMSESGWLTRSLEQPFPDNLEYEGKITPKLVKEAFLNTIDYVQNFPDKTESILLVLLNLVIKQVDSEKIKIIKKIDGDKININSLIILLNDHFSFNYKTVGGSKLPVLAFYAIYQILIKEIARYNNCYLEILSSHTASDLTSKSAGDIVIFNKDSSSILEAIEIKYGREINAHLIRIAKDKIIKYNPVRYYIFSSIYTDTENDSEVKIEISKINNEHGCQIIVNGILPTLKYYFRLITNLEDFIEKYGILIEQDQELKLIHKTKWNELLSSLSNK